MTKEAVERPKGRKNRGICCFLLELLEDESYSFVQWTNKEKGEFQIQWMHASSGAWEMKTDAETFRLWAKAKGKLEGREENYKTWKANFRCAMKSRHEIEEIKEPKGHRKKNIKLWKFNDMELVKRYKGGESFNWRRPRTKPITRKSSVVSNKRSRRNKRTPEAENVDNLEEETGTSPSCSDNCDSWSSSTQSTVTTTVLQSTYETKRTADQCIDMDDDELSSYGAGLLQIIARGTSERESTESVVPNIPVSVEDYSRDLLIDYEHQTTDNSSFPPYDQLPSPFHQNQSLSTEDSFSDNLLLEQDWELFGDLQMEKFKEVSTAARYFDNYSSEDLITDGDPFLYESIYTEL